MSVSFQERASLAHCALTQPLSRASGAREQAWSDSAPMTSKARATCCFCLFAPLQLYSRAAQPGRHPVTAAPSITPACISTAPAPPSWSPLPLLPLSQPCMQLQSKAALPGDHSVTASQAAAPLPPQASHIGPIHTCIQCKKLCRALHWLTPRNMAWPVWNQVRPNAQCLMCYTSYVALCCQRSAWPFSVLHLCYAVLPMRCAGSGSDQDESSEQDWSAVGDEPFLSCSEDAEDTAGQQGQGQGSGTGPRMQTLQRAAGELQREAGVIIEEQGHHGAGGIQQEGGLQGAGGVTATTPAGGGSSRLQWHGKRCDNNTAAVSEQRGRQGASHGGMGHRRGTLCVSSQVGCQMGCTFCATGA